MTVHNRYKIHLYVWEALTNSFIKGTICAPKLAHRRKANLPVNKKFEEEYSPNNVTLNGYYSTN